MHIGIDIGGTKTLGIVFSQGKILKETKKKSPKNNWENFIVGLISELTIKIPKEKIAGIGIGIAGVLDQKKEKLLKSPNLKNITGINLKKIVENKFKIETRLENDANCFCWGEYLYGAGKEFKNVIGLTLGTGLGCGIILNKKLYTGSFKSGSEAGHHIIRAQGQKCHCGSRGCFEQYASSQFIMRQSGNNPKTLYEKAKDGDKNALKTWRYYGYWLGIGIANLVNILEPEAVILGGNITGAWDYFIDEAQKTAKNHIFSPIAKKNIKILESKLGYRAGAIGAASLSRI